MTIKLIYNEYLSAKNAHPLISPFTKKFRQKWAEIITLSAQGGAAPHAFVQQQKKLAFTANNIILTPKTSPHGFPDEGMQRPALNLLKRRQKPLPCSPGENTVLLRHVNFTPHSGNGVRVYYCEDRGNVNAKLAHHTGTIEGHGQT